MKLDTSPIAAIATAPGRGGIGVVRASGKALGPLIDALFPDTKLAPRHATYIPFKGGDGSVIDQGLALYFKAPHSYTGEDVLELQGHGGPVVLQMLLARVLEAVNADQLRVIAEADAKASTLRELVPLLVNGIANVLRKHADLMRPMMLRATTDPLVSAAGKKSYAEVAERVQAMMLAHRDEIRQPDPERAVHSAYRVIYAAIARYLGFGSATTAGWEGDWDVLTEDLGTMCAAFLLSGD